MAAAQGSPPGYLYSITYKEDDVIRQQCPPNQSALSHSCVSAKRLVSTTRIKLCGKTEISKYIRYIFKNKAHYADPQS